MAELKTRTLDWITEAPVSAEGTGSTSASPAAVFAVLADHERWPEWFPGVRKVEVLGPAAGVGARRRVHIPGASVDEEFIAWEEGVRWSFTGTAARPGFVRSLVEDCQLSARADGGTDISYAMHLEPAGMLSPLLRIGAGALRRNLTKAVAQLAARAAHS